MTRATYEDGYNRGYLIAQARAESRQELGLPLVATAEYDEWLAGLRQQGMTIDEYTPTLTLTGAM